MSGAHHSDDGDFLSLGAGAVAALVILAIILKISGIQVAGWVRYAIIFIYVLLLCLCARIIDNIRSKRG